jgi:hypothetical protein
LLIISCSPGPQDISPMHEEGWTTGQGMIVYSPLCHNARKHEDIWTH